MSPQIHGKETEEVLNRCCAEIDMNLQRLYSVLSHEHRMFLTEWLIHLAELNAAYQQLCKEYKAQIPNCTLPPIAEEIKHNGNN